MNRYYPHTIIAQEGWSFIIGGLAASVFFSFLWGWWSLPFWIFTLFCVNFFRDPARNIPEAPDAVISPADGRVVVVERALDPYRQTEALKISVFMNVFNVHSQRSPVSGVVTEVKYTAGKFLNASLDKSSTENERNAVLMTTRTGRELTFVQVAGLVARRVLCYVNKGDTMMRGERYGFIRFGSRVDVYLPLDATANVAIGDKVRASETILAYLPLEQTEAVSESVANIHSRVLAETRLKAEVQHTHAAPVVQQTGDLSGIQPLSLDEARLAAETAKLKAEAEAAKQAAEQTKLAAEAEIAKLKAQTEQARAEIEQAKAKAEAEIAQAKVQAEAEMARLKAEQEAAAQAQAQAQAEQVAKAQAEQLAQAEAIAKAQAQAQAEQVAKAQAEAEAARQQAQQEAQARAQAEAQARAQAEQAAQAKAEAEAARQKAEQEAQARAQAEATAKAQAAQAAEAARLEAEKKAQAEAAARAQAEQAAKQKAEQEAKLKANEAKARAEEVAKAQAAAKAKEEALAKAKAEAEAKARAEQAARLKAAQEAKARLQAEQSAKEKAEAEALAEIAARKPIVRREVFAAVPEPWQTIEPREVIIRTEVVDGDKK